MLGPAFTCLLVCAGVLSCEHCDLSSPQSLGAHVTCVMYVSTGMLVLSKWIVFYSLNSHFINALNATSSFTFNCVHLYFWPPFSMVGGSCLFEAILTWEHAVGSL